MGYAIQTFDLTKKFGHKVAINKLNLKVPGGSIFAYLGPNGAGKTTTIKTLMNILTPSSGTAEVLGKNTRELGPEEFRQIGHVSENQELPEWMKIGQLFNYCRKMYPSWDDKFYQELVRQFDLPLNEKIKNISRGMKMKTALVSSLVYRPKLVVFDEPFSGLDPLVRQEFIDGILKITETENWTILISSHDIDEVERLADWVGIIDRADLKIQEETDVLLQRFRKVDVVLKDPLTQQPAIPESWLFPQYNQRSIQFIDSEYKEGMINTKLRELYPDVSSVNVSAMSLKEIFVALARKFKMSNF
jgi:ABC-2 type transport system ATP-binding protein